MMKKIIWYIDRDEQIGKILMEEFPKLTEDFVLHVIGNPLVIDEKLKQMLPNVIFIELGMALEDNGVMIKDLRAQKDLEKTPIIIFGSDVRLGDKAKELKVDSLRKPFDVRQLFEKARSVVKR